MRIYNYGSINIDHVYQVPHLVRPGETLASQHYQRLLGGKGANQSIALARAGAHVTHWGRYHAHDADLLAPLSEAGVDMSALQTVPEPSGHAIIQVDAHGENAIVLFGGANQSFQPPDVEGLLATAEVGDWLLLQNECSCTAAMIQAASVKGLHIAFNPAPMTAEVQALPLEKLAVLFVNESEVLALLGESARTPLDQDWLAEKLQQRWPQTRVVVTLGGQGACCFYQGEVLCVPAFAVEAVDTTGAGDTFIGYFMQALLKEQSLAVALQRACAAAALCVQGLGAAASIPAAQDVTAFLQAGGE